MTGKKRPDALSVAWDIFRRGDPAAMARAGGAAWDKQKEELSISYLGKRYLVSATAGVLDPAGRPAAFNAATLILQYLACASGLPPRGQWLAFLELPEGVLHHVPFLEQVLNPLALSFGSRGESFTEAGRLLGGRALTLGHRSFVVEALPRLPLAVVLWEQDEEFSARTNILFDTVAPASLSTAALWVLGQELANDLIEAAGR
ncbi:MAG TPA: DUF3786 domain-containing protein [Spirochaetia bacterium]|nr:DUF3786 domain-containing protein [Spirochaetia bacterium]